jgi:hypothetical protein
MIGSRLIASRGFLTTSGYNRSASELLSINPASTLIDLNFELIARRAGFAKPFFQSHETFLKQIEP